MAQCFYYNTSGEKIAATGEQIRQLAKQGTITPETIIENLAGKSMPAGQVKGLTFDAQPLSTPQTKPSTSQSVINSFFTEYGKKYGNDVQAVDKYGWTLALTPTLNSRL